MNDFKYDIAEFFYDTSFLDYPNTSAFAYFDSLMNAYRSQHLHIEGQQLIAIAPDLIRHLEFSNLMVDSFLPLNRFEVLPPDMMHSYMRVINYERSKTMFDNLPIHHECLISNVQISGDKILNIQDFEYYYQCSLITVNVIYNDETVNY